MNDRNSNATGVLVAIGALTVVVALGALLATRSPNNISEQIENQRAATTGGSTTEGSDDDGSGASATDRDDETCAVLATADPDRVSITIENGEVTVTVDGQSVELAAIIDCLPDGLSSLLEQPGLPDFDQLPGFGELPDDLGLPEDFVLPEEFTFPDIACPEGVSPDQFRDFELPPELEELFGGDVNLEELFDSFPPICTE